MTPKQPPRLTIPVALYFSIPEFFSRIFFRRSHEQRLTNLQLRIIVSALANLQAAVIANTVATDNAVALLATQNEAAFDAQTAIIAANTARLVAAVTPPAP